MGSRGLKFGSDKSLKSAQSYASKHGIQLNMGSFTRNGINKAVVENGLNYLNTIIDYLGMPEDSLPLINLHCKKSTRSSVIGACQLNSYSDDGNNIMMNPNYFKDSYVIGDKFSIHGDTFAHEYAHALESFLIKRNLVDISDRVNAWNDCLFAKGIIDRAIKNIGGNTSTWKKYAGEISSYAKTDHSECLAEVAKEFSHGGPQSDFVTSVMRELKKEVRKYKSHKRR